MVMQNKGGAQIPGPLGIFPENHGRQLPGPLGTTLWQKQGNTTAPATLVKAPKVTIMPLPISGDDPKDVHAVLWPLFSKKGLSYDEVKQAPGIANCPVAAILAALAFTSVGRSYIQGVLSESTGNVETDLSPLKSKAAIKAKTALANPPPGMKISSSRYFTVNLPKSTQEVSDVLYTDDGDRNSWSLLYLRDPSEQSIWAAIFEKALAVHLGSYENFDALNIKANDFWLKITGASPGVIEMKADTPLSTIINAAKNSLRVPTIGASNADKKDIAVRPGAKDADKEFDKVVTEFHGFSMLGLKGKMIQLYDPAQAKTILISPEDFRFSFKLILFGK
ncbi:MAG: C2 family cysteine protease [Methylococcales bacterium]